MAKLVILSQVARLCALAKGAFMHCTFAARRMSNILSMVGFGLALVVACCLMYCGNDLRGQDARPRPPEFQAMVFSPDGRTLASATKAGLCVWDTKSGESLWSYSSSTGIFRSIAFSPDSKLVITSTVSHPTALVVNACGLCWSWTTFLYMRSRLSHSRWKTGIEAQDEFAGHFWGGKRLCTTVARSSWQPTSYIDP